MITDIIWSFIRQTDLVFCLREIRAVAYIQGVPKLVIKDLLFLLLT